MLLLPRCCCKLCLHINAACTEGLSSICWASLLFLALASFCCCCTEARIFTGVGCLSFSTLVKRSFRDILVALSSTTFGADCAAIYQSQELKERDASAPPGAATSAAAGGPSAEPELTVEGLGLTSWAVGYMRKRWGARLAGCCWLAGWLAGPPALSACPFLPFTCAVAAAATNCPWSPNTMAAPTFPVLITNEEPLK